MKNPLKKEKTGHNIFHFETKNQPRDIFHYAKFGIIFEGILDLVASLPFINKKDLVVLVDRAQRQFNIEVLNDYIIKHQEFLDYRIETDVDQAIYEYEVSYYLIRNNIFLGDPPELDQFRK